jgi:hypothetical protein
MTEQNFKNLPKYVLGFHLVTFVTILASLAISILMIFNLGINSSTIFGILIALGLIFLFFYTRQFATGNQDRIIRAEENLRYYLLTGKMFDSRLTRDQIIALRFADDSEYVRLSEKAISQNLSSKNIKEAIQKWRADYHRI